MTMIDVTKPLELDDGTPVAVVTYDKSDVKVLLPMGKSPFRSGKSLAGTPAFWYSRHTGVYLTGNAKNQFCLRNRAMFQPGDKVFFRNGGQGVVVGNDGRHVYTARLGQHPWMDRKEVVGITSFANGRQVNSGTIESPDDISLTPWPAPVTHTFRNVYSDGTTGATAHKSLDTAKMAAKVGKTRIGILKVGSDGETELLRCKPSVRESGYTAATFKPLV